MAKKKKKTKPSPAYELLLLVWEHALSETGHSYDRLNRSMHGAMNLAIDSGFSFDSDTFARAMADFRGRFWFHDEGYYSLAVQTDNLSAAQAYEAWKEREPFIADECLSLIRARHDKRDGSLSAVRFHGRATKSQSPALLATARA